MTWSMGQSWGAGDFVEGGFGGVCGEIDGGELAEGAEESALGGAFGGDDAG